MNPTNGNRDDALLALVAGLPDLTPPPRVRRRFEQSLRRAAPADVAADVAAVHPRGRGAVSVVVVGAAAALLLWLGTLARVGPFGASRHAPIPAVYAFDRMVSGTVAERTALRHAFAEEPSASIKVAVLDRIAPMLETAELEDILAEVARETASPFLDAAVLAHLGRLPQAAQVRVARALLEKPTLDARLRREAQALILSN
jgi:hypothetical protein